MTLTSEPIQTATTTEEERGLLPAQTVPVPLVVSPLAHTPDPRTTKAGGEGRRARRAYEVLELYVERAARMHRSCLPSAVAPTMRVLLDIARLEGGQSTVNVAVRLSPSERRARILELAEQLDLASEE